MVCPCDWSDILERLGQLGRKTCTPAAFLGVTQPWLFRLFPGLFNRDVDLRLNQVWFGMC